MVLITGASGLLGQHLVAYLSAKGIRVRALYHSSPPIYYTRIDDSLVEWKQVDILDYFSLDACFDQITHVYHCAAVVSYDPRHYTQMWDVNVQGTEHILNLCDLHKVEKLLFVSSIATLGHTLHGEWITEKNEFAADRFTSHYAQSKYEAEMLVWQRIAEGLNAVIIHPAIILGEGDHRKSSTNLFQLVQEEFPFYTMGGTAWVDAKDVAHLMHELMQSDIQNDNFIVAAENRSFLSVFQQMAKALGVKPPSIKASPLMTSIVWRWSYLKSKLTGKTSTLTRETAHAAQETHHYDSSKLLHALPDFQFQPLNETIERIAHTMK